MGLSSTQQGKTPTQVYYFCWQEKNGRAQNKKNSPLLVLVQS